MSDILRSMILNNLVTTPEEAPRTLALAAVFWAIGIFLGPLVGGEFADNEHATWRWVGCSFLIFKRLYLNTRRAFI